MSAPFSLSASIDSSLLTTDTATPGVTDHQLLSHLSWTVSGHIAPLSLTGQRFALFDAAGAAILRDVGDFVVSTRAINTTLPLTGGGNLTADRTLAVNSATTSAVGVVELATDREDAANVAVQGNDGRLDPFVGSGASHATGLVPDPGAVAGTTKFLREDAAFAVPPGLGPIIGWGTYAAIPSPVGNSGGWYFQAPGNYKHVSDGANWTHLSGYDWYAGPLDWDGLASLTVDKGSTTGASWSITEGYAVIGKSSGGIYCRTKAIADTNDWSMSAHFAIGGSYWNTTSTYQGLCAITAADKGYILGVARGGGASQGFVCESLVSAMSTFTYFNEGGRISWNDMGLGQLWVKAVFHYAGGDVATLTSFYSADNSYWYQLVQRSGFYMWAFWGSPPGAGATHGGLCFGGDTSGIGTGSRAYFDSWTGLTGF